MEVPHFSVPIVALALKFPRREGVEEEFHRVVSVKGIANRSILLNWQQYYF